MLYYLSLFGGQYEALSFLRLFRYTTFRAGAAAFTAFTIAVLLGPPTVRLLRRMQMSAPGRLEEAIGAEVNPVKDKVPSMGGLLILVSVVTAIATWARPDVTLVYIFLFVILSLGALGFVDDLIKVRKQESRAGLTGRTKLIWQFLIAGIAVYLLDLAPETHGILRDLLVPFYKNPILVGLPIIPVVLLGAFVVVGSSNAVNLTDGMDGLATGCMVVAALTLGVFAYICGHATFANYLEVPFIPGSGEVLVIATAMAGAGLGFLWHNCYPASMFMGDTGSLSIGGALGLIAVLVKQELVLVLIGGVFVVEALSVMMQVGYFKFSRARTGTPVRLLLCAPIHHHFRMKGWAETQVVIRFWIIALICAGLGLATLKIR